jgi:hypothetical protein
MPGQKSWPVIPRPVIVSSQSKRWRALRRKNNQADAALKAIGADLRKIQLANMAVHRRTVPHFSLPGAAMNVCHAVGG